MTPEEKAARQKLLAPGQDKLQNAVNYLRMRANEPGLCLGYTRDALAPQELHLPPAQGKPNNTALWNFHTLAAAPNHYGWQATSLAELSQIGVRYVLAFFNRCATLPDGRIAGHIAIWDRVQNILYSSNDYPYKEFWSERLCGLFLPFVPAFSATPKPAAPPAPPPLAAKFYRDGELVGKPLRGDGLFWRSPGKLALDASAAAELLGVSARYVEKDNLLEFHAPDSKPTETKG